jgi:hypothetical protein
MFVMKILLARMIKMQLVKYKYSQELISAITADKGRIKKEKKQFTMLVMFGKHREKGP